jgi:hypothetical protein
METQNPTRIKLFWAKVIKQSLFQCWYWKGAKDRKFYGNFCVGKKKYNKASRFSYAIHFGPIPAGMQVDHRCNNPPCVNPFHLQLLTGTKNNEKSTSPSAINKRKTHCKYNHLLSEDNIKRTNGRRICLICEKEKGRL